MKLRKNKSTSIKKSVFYSLISIITISIVLLSAIWYFNKKQELINTTEYIKSQQLNQQKEYLKEEVNRAIDYITFTLEFHPQNNIDTLKNEILEYLARIRLKYRGYIFVNTIEGQALVFDGYKLNEYKNIVDMTDPDGIRLFDLEKKGYFLPDGLYFDYSFKTINSNIPEAKISYVKGYENWGWIIGAGFYKYEPTQEINYIEEEYKSRFRKDGLFILLLSIFLIVASYFIVRHIDYRLFWQINIFKRFLKDAAKSDQLIDLQSIQFTELKAIGKSINQMIIEKNDLTNQIIEKDKNLKSIFEAADNIGFIFTDLGGEDTIIKEFSPGAEKIFKYKKEEIISKKIALLHPAKDIPNFLKMQELLKKGLHGFHGETTLIRKNNKPFDAFFTIYPHFKENKIVGTIGITIDITKRKTVERELEKLKKNLEKIIEKRTLELESKNEELLKSNKKLENFNQLFIGREFRIKELKDKIKILEKQIKS